MRTKIMVSILVTVIAVLGLYGYFKATSGLENKAKNKPIIVIEPQIFDFGEVKYGKVVKHSFQLKNLGQKNLEIKGVVTSCPCTKASIVKDKIAPGAKTDLEVTYDTGAMSGPVGKGKQERIIYVKSNDPLNPQVEVEIYAMVQ